MNRTERIPLSDPAGETGSVGAEQPPAAAVGSYYTYLLRCEDGSIYTGITADLARRTAEHFSEHTNAKYTRAHRAVKMEAAFRSADRAAASRLEYRIKRLPRREKEAIIRERSLSPLDDVIDTGCYTYIDPSLAAQK